MKELFRFTSIRKLNSLTKEPCGKINLDDVTAKYYSQGIKLKDKKEFEALSEGFFKSAFNSDPLSINQTLTAIYNGLSERKKYSEAEIEKLCQDSFKNDVSTFVQDPLFLSSKNVIVENLFFLSKSRSTENTTEKIIYKQLLKIIGLLETISQKSICLEKILSNPSLQYYHFDILKNEPSSNGKDEKDDDKDIKKQKEVFKTEYDYILALKNAKNELLSLQGVNKNRAAIDDGKRKPPIQQTKKNAGLFGKFFGSTKSITPRDVEPDYIDSNKLFLNENEISDSCKQVLLKLGFNPKDFDIYGAINKIHDEIILRSNKLNSSLSKPRYMSYQGKSIATGYKNPIGRAGISGDTRNYFFGFIDSLGNDFDNDVNPSLPAVPSGHGFAKILGEGQLLRVEEEYKGCVLANLGSVVNIPPYSEKTYRSRNLTRTVSTSESESIENTQDETATESRQTTNLSNEVNKVQEFDLSLEAGLNVSASYGPTVGVEASSNFSTSLSSSETTNTASSYAKDVTQRAIKRIEKISREFLRTERTTENEIKNKEGYKNDTAVPAVGIYQWINEVYNAKLVQYDSRLLLEFMVPEPGNLLIYAANNPYETVNNPLPEPPHPFDIGPEDVTPDNYPEHIETWAASDIAPPPAPTITVAKTISGPDKTETGDNRVPIHIKLSDDTLTIPEGYNVEYIKAKITTTRRYNEGDDDDTGWHHYGRFLVNIDYTSFYIDDESRKEYKYINYTDSRHWNNIPISVTGFQARTFVLSLNVYCLANVQAYQKWQMETFTKLKQAYQRQLDEYNDKLALAKQRAFLSGSFGNNPDKNRKNEKDELKRACVSILTNQSFENFDSINDPINKIPVIKFDQVKQEGDYVRFFENAFEWTQLIYVLYPYFWANPNKTWLRSMSLGLDDAKHEEFLKSGFARVVIPVRPEFQNAILQYLESGLIWDGRDPDDIDLNDPMYVQISTEIMERQGRLQQTPEIIDEWEYELPTNHQIISNGLPIPFPKPFI